MMTTRTWIPTVAALALLVSAGCKKQDSTSPDDASANADEDADADEDEDADEDADEDDAPALLTKASFDETIYDNLQVVSDCYVAALEANPELGGTLEADFSFGADGVPTGVVAAEGSTLSDEGVVQCIADAAKGWGFDPPKNEGMTLRYQFNLEPAE